MAAVLERPMHDTTEPLGPPPAPRREPRWAPLLAVDGLVCMALAVTLLARHPQSTTTAAAARPEVVLTSGAYEPGHSSGWHVHPGLHSVVVLSGTLTFHDERCQRHDVGPGDAYVGGDRPHLVRNETSEPVTYVVTYVRVPSAAVDPGAAVAAPTGCDLR